MNILLFMKTIIIFIMMLSSMGIFGMDSVSPWFTLSSPGDELEGIKPYIAYSMGNSTGKVIIYDRGSSNDSVIVLKSGDYSFFSWEWDSFCNAYSYATIGIYDENNNLIERNRIRVGIDNEGNNLAFLRDKKILISILNYLTEPNYKIRFVMNRYNKNSFDVTIEYSAMFEKIAWIPANIKRAEDKERQRKVDEEQKKNEILKKNKLETLENKLKQFESVRLRLIKKEDICKKNGYMHSLKITKSELIKINKDIEKIKNEISELNK